MPRYRFVADYLPRRLHPYLPPCAEDCRPRLVKIIASTGVAQFRLRCAGCPNTGHCDNIPWRKLTEEERQDAITWRDNVHPDRRCARCGALGVELHHWAPAYLFDDAGEWPTSYLCQPCHARWHRIMLRAARR